MMKNLIRAVLVCLVAFPYLFADETPEPVYKSGYSTMMNLGKDLHTFLPSPHKEKISAQPISIETDVTPFVRLLFYPDEPTPIRGVWISAGFIDLVNNVAHAKAIDRTKKGYFADYIELLSQETGEFSLRNLPGYSAPEYWSDDMLNEQLSNFNSIVGTVVAIKLAHHYLGHYDKYKEQLTGADGSIQPINKFLTAKEWDEAFTHGVRNALEAGCTTEGVIPFFEAFDKMKQRPAWAAYFLPNDARFSRMKKEMQKLQREFFGQ